MSLDGPFRKVPAADGHMTVAPMPAAEALADFYARVYYQERPSFSYQAGYDAAETEYKRLLARQLVYALETAAGRPGGRLLEIGCGEGFTLAAARDAGWRVSGTDLADHALKTFHPELADCLTVGDLHDALGRFAAAGERFDAVVLQNVLEHLPDPERALAAVRARLAADGLAAVALPNDESPLQRRLLERGAIDRDYWFIPPQHLHYFDIAAGRRLAAACGFQVVDLYSDFPIEVFLFHPGSNFVADRTNGPAAHRARIEITAVLAAAGLPAFHSLCRAQAGCGVGRAFTMLLRSSGTMAP